MFTLGVALLLLSWSFASRPFAGPDEAPHYLRALSIANGHPLGRKTPDPNPGLTPEAHAFVNADSRAVYVPAGLSPWTMSCADGKSDTHGCTEVSPTGDYFPLPYLLPAVGISVAHTAVGGLWLARLGSVLPCIALFASVAFALWEIDAWSLAGLIGALTPMVLFVSSILNPSGLETAASIAFAGALLRLTRPQDRPPPGWLWGLIAVSGAVTILSFQAGPGFAAIILVLVGLLWRRRDFMRVVRTHRAAVTSVVGVLVLSLIAWVAYSRVAGADHSTVALHPIRANLRAGFRQLGPVLRDAIGTFGGLTIPLPAAVRGVWFAGEAALILMALAVACWRDRLAMIVPVCACLAFPVISYAFIYRTSGFGMQGRQVLGVLALIPLIAGAITDRNWRTADGRPARTRIATRPALAAMVGLYAVGQAYAWSRNAHASGFFSHLQASPPLGTAVWLATAIAGVALILAAAAASTLPSSWLTRRRTAMDV